MLSQKNKPVLQRKWSTVLHPRKVMTGDLNDKLDNPWECTLPRYTYMGTDLCVLDKNQAKQRDLVTQ